MAYHTVRVSGEGFDADQVTLPCDECGRDENGCECESDDESWPVMRSTMTLEEAQARIAAAFPAPTGWALAEQSLTLGAKR